MHFSYRFPRVFFYILLEYSMLRLQLGDWMKAIRNPKSTIAASSAQLRLKTGKFILLTISMLMGPATRDGE